MATAGVRTSEASDSCWPYRRLRVRVSMTTDQVDVGGGGGGGDDGGTRTKFTEPPAAEKHTMPSALVR